MEKVRIFQDMLENLYAITPYARKFVEEHFSKIDKNWFERYVIPKMDDSSQYEYNITLEDVDLYTLLKVLISNWTLLRDKFPSEMKFKNGANKKLLQDAKQVRNDVAHLKEVRYQEIEDMDADVETLGKLARFFGTTLDECKDEMYKDENDEIRAILFGETTDQAIAREDEFKAETMKSIKRTRAKLEKMKTTKEIIEFLKDALQSERGQAIGREVQSKNLRSFENTAPKIIRRYYGLVAER